MIDYLTHRWPQIWFDSLQHVSLVAQCVVVAALIALIVAAACYRSKPLSGAASSAAALGLTIPSFALVGILIGPLGFGVAPAFAVVTFYAALPIVRNAIVGLRDVDASVVEAARAVGMSRTGTFLRVELPLAWPVILAGIRVSTQMSMGIATVAAYVLGPGLGSLVFSGLSRLGGAGSLESVVTGIVMVVAFAVLLDLLLVLLGKLTMRGPRVRT